MMKAGRARRTIIEPEGRFRIYFRYVVKRNWLHLEYQKELQSTQSFQDCETEIIIPSLFIFIFVSLFLSNDQLIDRLVNRVDGDKPVVLDTDIGKSRSAYRIILNYNIEAFEIRNIQLPGNKQEPLTLGILLDFSEAQKIHLQLCCL